MLIPDILSTVVLMTTHYFDKKQEETSCLSLIENRTQSVAQEVLNTSSTYVSRSNELYPALYTSREERVFLEDPNQFMEKATTQDGNCLFHSIHYWLHQYRDYLLANRLLASFNLRIPDAHQLRYQAVQYIKQNYRSDPELQTLVDYSLQEYNDQLKLNFKNSIRDYLLLLGEIDVKLKNETYEKLHQHLTRIIEKDDFSEILSVKIYIYRFVLELSQRPIFNTHAIKLLERLNIAVSARYSADVDTYFDLYSQPGFFGNRDAIYALSQRYKINFYTYQKRNVAQRDLLQPGEPRILMACSSNEIPSLLEQQAPIGFLVYRGFNHYNILDRK